MVDSSFDRDKAWLEFSKTFEKTNNFSKLIKLIPEFTAECFGTDRVSIAIFDQENHHFVNHILHHNVGKLQQGTVFPADETMLLQAIESKKTLIWSSQSADDSHADIEDLSLNDLKTLHELGFNSSINAPIEWHGETIGTVNINSNNPLAFTPDAKKIVSKLARYLGSQLGQQEYKDALSTTDIIKLAESELELMNLLWSQGPLSISDAHTLFKHPIGYPTMQTRLNRLVKKGCLIKTNDRPARYEPAITPETAAKWYVQTFQENLGNLSVVPIIKLLVKSHNFESTEELDNLINYFEAIRDDL